MLKEIITCDKQILEAFVSYLQTKADENFFIKFDERLRETSSSAKTRLSLTAAKLESLTLPICSSAKRLATNRSPLGLPNNGDAFHESPLRCASQIATNYQRAFSQANAFSAETERKLWESFGRPDFNDPESLKQLLQYISSVVPMSGFFLKYEKAAQFLSRFSLPGNDLVQTYGSLRFTLPREELNAELKEFYINATADDFEERNIAVEILKPELAEKAVDFVKHKYHNLTHLKELGAIFIIPGKLENKPGYFLRNLGLLIHYFYEVGFYSDLIREHRFDPDFGQKLYYALSGAVPTPPSDPRKISIVQRYLFKDNPNDPLLFVPRVNTEALIYHRAEKIYAQLTNTPWQDFSYAGDFFTDSSRDATPVAPSIYDVLTGARKSSINRDAKFLSFNFLDLAMNLFNGDFQTNTTYHQAEALWNQLFFEALGEHEVERLTLEYFFEGTFDL